MVRTKSHIPRRPKGGAAKRALCGVRMCRGKAGVGDAPLPVRHDRFAAGKRAPRRCAPTKAARRICRAGAEGVFRRNQAGALNSPRHLMYSGGAYAEVLFRLRAR